MSATASVEEEWIDVCSIQDLQPNAGVGALLAETQVALFYLPDEPEHVFVIGNYDPIGRANVLARGIVGSLGDRLVVASPLYKQHFDLRSGECVEEQGVSVPVYPVRLVDGRVEIYKAVRQ